MSKELLRTFVRRDLPNDRFRCTVGSLIEGVDIEREIIDLIEEMQVSQPSQRRQQ
jgi:hypothetical protein